MQNPYEQLDEELNSFALSQLGYETFDLQDVTFYSSSVKISFQVTDQFQTYEYYCGWQELRGPDLADIIRRFSEFPNRERRELNVMAQRLNALGKTAEASKCEAISEIMGQIQDAISKAQNALTDMRGESEQDRIPF